MESIEIPANLKTDIANLAKSSRACDACYDHGENTPWVEKSGQGWAWSYPSGTVFPSFQRLSRDG